MQVNLKAIIIDNKKQQPFFKLIQQKIKFNEDAIIVKVLSFSIDPVMRVWLAGAKTNFRTVGSGDIFNAFGVGVIVRSRDQDYPEGSYLFGNTGTSNYLELDQGRKKECFPIDSQLVEQFGPFRYLYLINNGLAAYQGFEILNVKPSETVVVSTAAGATGLLLCHLLKKRNANIVALCSPNKKKYVQPYTTNVINYKDQTLLRAELSKLNYSKYFDNVGESQLDLILSTIQRYGIIAMCGAIEHYLTPKEGGISNLFDLILKRIKLEGINFATLIGRIDQIFKEYEDAELLLHVEKMQQFLPLFIELFKSGGSVVGKIVIDPHL